MLAVSPHVISAVRQISSVIREDGMSEQIKLNEDVVSPQAEINPPRYLSAPKICHNLNCNFQTHEPLSKCPKCRRPIWTTNEFRLISLPIIFCGFFLSGIGGGLLYFAAPQIIGSMAAKIFITGIFGVILAFGLCILAIGLWQVLFGIANRRLIFIFLALLLLGMLIIGFGRLILILLSES